jgi:hypothetical protein
LIGIAILTAVTSWQFWKIARTAIALERLNGQASLTGDGTVPDWLWSRSSSWVQSHVLFKPRRAWIASNANVAECLEELYYLPTVNIVCISSDARDDSHHDPEQFGRCLAKLSTVESLELMGMSLSDHDLQSLSKMPRLRHLVLQRCEMTRQGLQSLRQCHSLRELSLEYSRCNGGLHAEIASLNQLQSLDLTGCPTEDHDLKQWGGQLKLKELNLSFTDVTDKGLAHLTSMKSLGTLCLADTEVGDRGMLSLSKLSEMKNLDLSHTKITDAGLTPLASLKLQSLNLRRTALTDASIPELCRIAPLHTLELRESKITVAGCLKFADMHPDVVLPLPEEW